MVPSSQRNPHVQTTSPPSGVPVLDSQALNRAVVWKEDQCQLVGKYNLQSTNA